MKPDRYDDKSARAHIKKLVDILEHPPVLTMNAKGQELEKIENEEPVKRHSRSSSIASSGSKKASGKNT